MIKLCLNSDIVRPLRGPVPDILMRSQSSQAGHNLERRGPLSDFCQGGGSSG